MITSRALASALTTLSLALTALGVGSVHAEAANTSTHLKAMAGSSALMRATLAFGFCTEIFKAAQTPNRQTEYRRAILELGEAWKTQPDYAYQTLDTCQTMWVSEYLDPLKAVTIHNQFDLLRANNIIASEGLFGIPSYLGESIRGFLSTKPAQPPGIPLAPFEILSGLAATERQLDHSLEVEQRRINAQFAASGFATASVGIQLVRGVGAASMSAGTFWKQFLLVTAAAWGIERLEENRNWRARSMILRLEVRKIAAELLAPTTSTPRPLLLDQYYRAVETLGYFYSHELYLSDSGQSERHVTPTEECYRETKNFFAGASEPSIDLAEQFLNGRLCGDAAAVWLSASLLLQRRLPRDAQALQVADRLMSKSKRVVQAYEATRLYMSAQMDCQARANPMRAYSWVDCDPTTGDVNYYP